MGDGTTNFRGVPVQASGLTGAVAVAAGGGHSMALKGDGTVWAWGWNAYGQLGDGTTTDRGVPVQVSGLTGVVALAAGNYHSLAVKSDGTVWAWGYNAAGQLGDGTTSSSSVPVPVSGLTGVAAVAAGTNHSLAVKRDGTVWAWGQNGSGQLGDGTTTFRNVLVQVSGLTGVVGIAAGYQHSVAVKSDGTVWTWGLNQSGQLGDSTATDRTVPVPASGLTGLVAVAAGANHSMAMKNDGTVWAWGLNNQGQLGDGSTTDRSSPVQVKGIAGAVAIAAGGTYSAAVKSGGAVWEWGVESYSTDDNVSLTASSPAQALIPTGSVLAIISAPALPFGTTGVPYSQMLAASGGTPPYRWAVLSGTFPAGFTLSSTGAITGTPAAVGASTFTITVTDVTSAIAAQAFTLTILAPAAGAVTITTPPQLLSGSLGSSFAQTLTASGGTPPYAWSLVSGAIPAGLLLSSSGIILGVPASAGVSTFTLQAMDSVSARSTQTFTLVVISPGGLVRSGVLAHIASGGSWKTTIILTNPSTVPVAARIIFRADDGSTLNLPLSATQQGTVQVVTSSSLDRVINPNSTLLIESEAQTTSIFVGWADVMSSGSLNGFAIFRTTTLNNPTSEGTVPLQTQFPSKIALSYDQTAGSVMGFAMANLASSGSAILATIWDENGVEVGSQGLTVSANGHSSFNLADKLPLTGGKRGVVQFQSTAGGGLSGIGLRFSSYGSFTSIPTVLLP
ncbi:MAG: putative Ig domain-containing protein [Acidobacteria bacterium]|nr:putative Ig domain-containing protein [Acidobacteriota bacterium]